MGLPPTVLVYCSVAYSVDLRVGVCVLPVTAQLATFQALLLVVEHTALSPPKRSVHRKVGEQDYDVVPRTSAPVTPSLVLRNVPPPSPPPLAVLLLAMVPPRYFSALVAARRSIEDVQ